MDELDQQREIIQEDLRGLIAGEVRCDNVFVQLYASDGSIYEIRPLGVVRPRSSADVVACVQYAAEKEIPLHARGAGTGVAGESLGRGLVVDFSRFMRRILRSDEETVRVQPGAVHDRLAAYLHRRGRCFGPDPATSPVTTVGSMLAIDASGSRWLQYGSARDHVRSLQIVLADGHLLEVGREPLIPRDSHADSPWKRQLVDRLAALLREHAELIRSSKRNCPSDRCGYKLTDVLSDGHLDLARLLVGSEGTLALITEATLATQPLPRHRGMVLLLFDSLEKASRAVLDILPAKPTACDLMDRRHLSLARETEVRLDVLIPQETEAVLLVEMEADDPIDVINRVQSVVNRVWHAKRLAFGARQGFDPQEMKLFWHLVKKVEPALCRMKGSSRPVPVVEDMAVAPEVLPEFLVRMQNILKEHELTTSLFCHAGQGQLHIQPFLNLDNRDDVTRMRRLAEALYREVLDVGGTISGEHACGLSRTSFIRQQVGPLYKVFRQVKEIFDPQNLLNPGKIVGNDSDLMVRDLRPTLPAVVETSERGTAMSEPESPELRDLAELQVDWDPSRVVGPVSDCNLCGDCRTQEPDLRMCPIFRLAPREEASPRAKAQLIRGLLTGGLELSSLTGDAVKEVADLCIHCHMCPVECPAGVDIPKLMHECKGAYVAANGLRWTDWLLTRLDLVSTLGSRFRPVANWALRNRQARWLMEKTLGIAQGRKLPQLASRSFLHHAATCHLGQPKVEAERKVVYFVDLYANYFDPQLAKAFVAVLQHNGVAVYVPPLQQQAGMASVARGALDHARRLAKQNVRVLGEPVRQGYQVVATEPSAALCLTHEYPQLLDDDDDARQVADASSEACGFLWKMHLDGQLQLDLKPIEATLGYHMPCHSKALGAGSPAENLLRLIPQLRVYSINGGCSGMAGTFGIKRVNYRRSLRAGWRLISRLRDPGIQAGTTECSACKMQMEQGSTKPTIHPIKLLALSYGLMPEIEGLLTTRSEELIVT